MFDIYLGVGGSWAGEGYPLIYFFSYVFVFCFSDPVKYELLMQRNCCVCCLKLLQKSVV